GPGLAALLRPGEGRRAAGRPAGAGGGRPYRPGPRPDDPPERLLPAPALLSVNGCRQSRLDGAARTVVQTLPPASRSPRIRLSYSGGSLGALATPLLVTPTALTWGLRAARRGPRGAGVVW